MTQTQAPPVAVMFQMVTSKWVSSALGLAAHFGIADHLSAGPLGIEDLARLSATDPQSLYRLLRATASVGVFREREDGRFEQTDLSDCLRSDSPQTIRNLAMMFTDDWHARAWAALDYSVATGKPSIDKVCGMPGFEWFAKNPEQAKNFNAAMTDISRAHAPRIAEAYDFSGVTRLIDVGGGLGMLLAAILKRNPALQGGLCDMPYVIEQARTGEILASYNGRCSFHPGSFLESVPAGGDAYIMKHILHDWDDDRCRTILKNVRAVIPANGKLLVVDRIVAPGNEPDVAKLMDLEMLAVGGRERTEREWRDLFASGGFDLARIVPTRAGIPIIEGIPV